MQRFLLSQARTLRSSATVLGPRPTSVSHHDNHNTSGEQFHLKSNMHTNPGMKRSPCIHSFSHCELLVHQPGVHSAHCHHAYLSPEGPRFRVSCGINRINMNQHSSSLQRPGAPIEIGTLLASRWSSALSDTTVPRTSWQRNSAPRGSHS